MSTTHDEQSPCTARVWTTHGPYNQNKTEEIIQDSVSHHTPEHRKTKRSHNKTDPGVLRMNRDPNWVNSGHEEKKRIDLFPFSS